VFNPTSLPHRTQARARMSRERLVSRSIESTVVSSLLFSVSFSRSARPRLGCLINVPYPPLLCQALFLIHSRAHDARHDSSCGLRR